jgi:hypothetical protein
MVKPPGVIATAAVCLLLAGCAHGEKATQNGTSFAPTAVPATAPSSAAPPGSPARADIGGPLTAAGAPGQRVIATVVRVGSQDPASSHARPAAGSRFLAVQLRLDNQGDQTYRREPALAVAGVEVDGGLLPATLAETISGPALTQGRLELDPGAVAELTVFLDAPLSVRLSEIVVTPYDGGQTVRWRLGD